MPIVFDIETVPDADLWQPPEDNPEAFPPVIACRPVVISYVHLDADNNPKKIGSIRSAEERPELDTLEVDVLTKWSEGLLKQKAPLISWNGRRFDLPVLLQRCFAWGIRHPDPLQKGSYGYRYSTEMHADVMDILGIYGAARACSLDATARAIGLPGKSFETGGSVAKLFAAGQYDHICSYCETDAFQTAGVWLRWLLTSGSLDLSGYKDRCQELLRLGDNRLPYEFRRLIRRPKFLCE